MKKRRSWAGIYGLTVVGLLAAMLWGNNAVSALAEQLPPVRGRCFLIDAGHGGVDGGAISCTGRSESGYNLEIALRLNDLLHFLGYETRMIRTEDVSVHTSGQTIAQKKVSDLKERVRICNETENAVLLSIHQNTYPDPGCSGAQVFSTTSQESRNLAAQLQQALTETLNPGSSRKSKQARGVYLMEHIRCTGVLIECGFLSNPEEEAKLRNEAYQKLLCCVIASSVVVCGNP